MEKFARIIMIVFLFHYMIPLDRSIGRWTIVRTLSKTNKQKQTYHITFGARWFSTQGTINPLFAVATKAFIAKVTP